MQDGTAPKSYYSNRLPEYYDQLPELDTENAIDSIGGSVELYDKLCRQVVRRIPDGILSMDQDVTSEGRLASFAITVHGLKSSLRQIGYRTLANLAETIELEAKDENISKCFVLYEELKKELKLFHTKANALISAADEKNGANTTICGKRLSEFKHLLENVRDALDGYDTLTATELIAPLSGYRFEGAADEELSMAFHDLEEFQPLQALVHIQKLLELC